MQSQKVITVPFEEVKLHRDPNAWKPGKKENDADDPMHAVSAHKGKKKLRLECFLKRETNLSVRFTGAVQEGPRDPQQAYSPKV